MNSNKVIIMEIKDDYAIAMTPEFEFIKIKKKKSMQEGQKIYIVDEDICYSDEKVPFFKNKNFIKGLGLLVILIGAILVVWMLLNPFKNNSYAVISLDGNSGLEMKLDENKHVVEATSRDNSIPNKELDYIEGETLDDAIEHVSDLLENDNYVLAGYSISDENNTAYDKDLKSTVQKYLPYTLFIKSDMDDVKLADSEDMTLGKYELKDIHYLEELESCVEKDIDYTRLDKFIVANSKLIEKGERIRKEIANMENKSKNDDDSNNNNSNNSNDDDDDDDEEDDDDDDDD
ncbi:anti-sigma factor domain-containing protein [Intestinibacter sp.]|uniref:anti-sigma factor domain-containing protein n=1 Tax=Intestinibacter sp. TaxID=1965304 RepID=UPI003F154CD7